MHSLGALPPIWVLTASGLQQAMHLSLASKLYSATIYAVDVRSAVLVGYMRVSTVEQNLALQRDALLSAGIAPERVYQDTCSGTVIDRSGIARALEVVRDGDALVIWKLDRIGCSLKHAVELVDDLQKRDVGLKVLTGGIDTTSSTGRLVLGIFATLSEFERDPSIPGERLRSTRQRVRYSSAIRPALTSPGRLLHSRIVVSPSSVGASSASSMRRHREAIPRSDVSEADRGAAWPLISTTCSRTSPVSTRPCACHSPWPASRGW